MVILIICGSKKQLCCYGEHFQQPAHNWLNLRYKSISEILTIKRYWNLIGWETFLAVTWQSDFPQECSFCRMLMNYKNFHFTKIPDKTNDVVFLKSPKTMFLGHFLPFLVIFSWRGFFFPKKIQLCHTQIYMGKFVKFQKKLMRQSRENLRRRKDGLKDRQKDQQTLFYRTLPDEARGPTSLCSFINGE